MKITIEEQECLKKHLTLKETLLLLAIKNEKSYTDMLESLIKRGIIGYNNNHYQIAVPWEDTLDEILVESSGGIDSEERLSNLAKQMRECYPEGKLPGTPYYYRCNNREIMLKLKKFFMQYGNYSDQKIIDATKRFVASYRGNYRYLPLIKYFISKNKPVMGEDGKQHVSEVSELASYLENKEVDTNADWMLTTRN